MRKQDKVVLWPVYFDSTKTRLEGRKVPKGLAVPAPTLEEIRKAAMLLGLRPEIVSDAAYPSFSRQKTGLVTVPKKESKTQIIRKIAEKMLLSRSGHSNSSLP